MLSLLAHGTYVDDIGKSVGVTLVFALVVIVLGALVFAAWVGARRDERDHAAAGALDPDAPAGDTPRSGSGGPERTGRDARHHST